MGRGKPVVLSNRTFATRTAAHEHFSAMLKRYHPNERVSDVDAKELESLLQRHPRAKEKIGLGVDHFEVQAADFSTQCFRVVRPDGTWARFSYKTCISPEHDSDET